MLLGALSGVLALTVLAGAPTASEASSTYLCTGYSACNRAGYSDGGYGANNGRMYWRMYAGHNCTNYVAYRMIRAGMSTERPWSGSGMAYNWGHAMASITDQTPRVGAVAWYDRYSGGVGSSGHVAVVERVISNREIVISEDSWGGDFDWRRITKDGRGWPSGFIHFVDEATPVLTSTSPPTVTGTPKVGEMVRATVGGWRGGPRSYTFQWSADGVAIPGATFTGYVPTADQVGSRLSVQVSAHRTGYESGTAASAQSAAIAKGTLEITRTTQVTGTAQVGEVLSATPATFSPEPASRTLQWRADGAVIPGSGGRSLTVDESLLDTTITVLTIARAEGYAKATAHSAPLGPVTAAGIEVTEPFTVAGRPLKDETLTIQPGTYSPPDSAYYYTWLRDSAPIPGATAATYTLTAGDVGREVSAQVRLARAQHTERVETVPVGVVRTPGSVRVRSFGRVRKALVRVQVRGAGATPPSGEVVVRIGKQKLTGVLQDGRVPVRVSGLAPGKRKVVVRFTGSEVVTAARGTAWVRVKRPKR